MANTGISAVVTQEKAGKGARTEAQERIVGSATANVDSRPRPCEAKAPYISTATAITAKTGTAP